MRDIDPLYLEMMRRIARGESVPWKLDERYTTEGSPEQRYSTKPSDRQALLWEIFLAADEGREIESWAVPEIRHLMYRLLIGGVRDWNDEFGTPLAKKNTKGGPRGQTRSSSANFGKDGQDGATLEERPESKGAGRLGQRRSHGRDRERAQHHFR